MLATNTEWAIRGLPASGPDPALKGQLMLFGQFVGAWKIVRQWFPLSNTGVEEWVGEVHFNWVLGGRAIQDVWGQHDPESGHFMPVGTTLRMYDPKLRAWRSTWISPVQNEVRTFIGRPVGSEIVLNERNRGPGCGERWVFSQIRPRSFEWRAERRGAGGGPWEIVELLSLRRDNGGETAPSRARR